MSAYKNLDPSKWAKTNFSGVHTTDIRRTKRVINLATKMAECPGETVPQLADSLSEAKAYYNLFDHTESTPENLQRGHRELVFEELQKPGEYLLIGDTTEMIWSNKSMREGTGPIGNFKEGIQGFCIHTTLAVRFDQELSIIGLAEQTYFNRSKTAGKSRKDYKGKIKRESDIWYEVTNRLPLPPKNVKWTRVCDSAADFYEVLLDCQIKGFGYVIRACQDRCVEGENLKLFDVPTELYGEFDLELRGRGQKKKRIANLTVRVAKVCIQPPKRPGQKNLPSINCSVLFIKEENAKEDVEPLEWILLCDRDISRFEEALECIKKYTARWLIEEFHKALKTGLGAEDLQLETAKRLHAAIAIMSVVALRLIDMRSRLRIHPQRPASESGLSDLEIQILEKYLKRSIITVQDANLAVGRLGGHLNRKSDGMPGILTLWRGMKKLYQLVEGFMIAESLK